MKDLPDDVLLPLKERLSDWLDPDVAGFFLGKALGVIPVEQSWGLSKGIFWEPEPIGLMLADTLQHLVDAGILETQDDQFRWRAHSSEQEGSS